MNRSDEANVAVFSGVYEPSSTLKCPSRTVTSVCCSLHSVSVVTDDA